jgi:hypothetical protein
MHSAPISMYAYRTHSSAYMYGMLCVQDSFRLNSLAFRVIH